MATEGVPRPDGIIELVTPPSIPIPSQSDTIELPSTVPTPQLVGTDSIAPAGTIVTLPTTLPTEILVGMDTITPVGDTITIPAVVPPDGVILLELIDLPTYGQARGVEKLIELLDINITRVDGDILVFNDTTNTYIHTAYQSDLSYTHTQVASVTSWNIAHNLGKRPAITVTNGAGREVKASVTHTDANNAIAYFGKAYSGVAYCN
jgi:hypothetical protein